MKVGGVQLCRSHHEHEADAARAAYAHYGDFAYLNFPDSKSASTGTYPLADALRLTDPKHKQILPGSGPDLELNT